VKKVCYYDYFQQNQLFLAQGVLLYLDPVDCSKESICNFAWLQRYNASVGVSALLCSNETIFHDLISAGYNHCS